ncbi:TPA: hypothetical protein F8R88_09080 [Legionella pneumophila]|nr:hypothetical protein DI110_13420 [Legionella pneumophila]HAT9116192.1 hypothetical protein [Legionella pneumophila subsp. pneumophila]HAT7923363.1 hypothetical protein [Legionella pneumophila]HAT8310797.1 hypothetical protein [Legionella pneumophila]HAT8326190.1 hypothetical protein [Legionella pneumophila]
MVPIQTGYMEVLAKVSFHKIRFSYIGTEMEKTVILLNVQIDYLKRNLKCCINCSWIINTLWKRYSRHPIIDFSLFRHAIPKHYFTKERHKIRNKLSACLTQAQNIPI